jgi:hypothetical protein
MSDNALSRALDRSSPRPGLVTAGLILVGGSGVLVGGLNLLFVLLVARISGVRGFSLGGPLFSIGSVVAVISVGPEYALMQRLAQRGTKEATRAFFFILVVLLAFLLLAPLVALVLHTSLLLGLLGMLNAGSCLLAAPLNAGFLMEDRPFVIVGLGVGEALFRFSVLAFAQRSNVLALALGVGTVVNLLGSAVGLVVLGLRRAPGLVDVTESITPGIRGLTNSLLALGLYLPFVIPQWMARLKLPRASAGLLDVALLLAGGVMMLAGHVTSATIPRVLRARSQEREAREDLRTGLRLVFTIAVTGAFGAVLLGSIVLPLVVHLNTTNLLYDLLWLLPAAVGWSGIGYGLWVRSIDSVLPGLPMVWVGCLIVLALGVSRSLVPASPFYAAVLTTALCFAPVLWPLRKQQEAHE